jgi:hypothetical protein
MLTSIRARATRTGVHARTASVFDATSWRPHPGSDTGTSEGAGTPQEDGRRTQTFLAQELRERADKSAEDPGELLQLEARLERLRRRLADGDPDIAPDDQQITKGLDGDPEASTDARLILKDLIPNRILLSSKADGTLWGQI